MKGSGPQLELGIDGYKLRHGTASQERMRWRRFKIGGPVEYQGFIPDSGIPVCTEHSHGPVDRTLMALLVRVCLVPLSFRRACLTSAWNGHEAGTTCLTYGREDEGACGWMLYVDNSGSAEEE